VSFGLVDPFGSPLERPSMMVLIADPLHVFRVCISPAASSVPCELTWITGVVVMAVIHGGFR